MVDQVWGLMRDCAPQVTVDLDVMVRDDLLNFLVQDSEERGATIICELGSPVCYPVLTRF